MNKTTKYLVQNMQKEMNAKTLLMITFIMSIVQMGKGIQEWTK